MIETEVKIKLTDAEVERVLVALPKIGFVRTVSAQEYNALYDTPDKSLAQGGELLRLRVFDGKHILTYKGSKIPSGTFKSREEVETTVGDMSVIKYILSKLDYSIQYIYIKNRTVFININNDNVEVCLDKTPGGYYLEIEGGEFQIMGVASKLGFNSDRFISESYPEIYKKFEE